MKHLMFGIVGLLVGGVGQAEGREQPRPLRLVSYNIRHGAGTDGKVDLDRVAKVISAQHPDVVALQEVDKNCTRSGNLDIAAKLGAMLGMEPRFGRFMDFQGGEYGMAVLSRLPVVETVRHPLPKGAEPRCALEVRVQVSGLPTPVSFVCIHNDWTKEEIRVRQVAPLLEALKAHENPVVLAGDFNGERSDKSVKLLGQAGWRILKKNRADEYKTWPAGAPRVEIDFFMIRGFPEVSIDHDVIDERVASDHRPIRAVIHFPERQ